MLAAALEASGDAIIRSALRTSGTPIRIALLALGAFALFVYGYVVVSPPWNFGKLLGLYIVFFFVIAQILAYFVFGETPNRSLAIGGALIVGGGLVIALSQS